jgi:pimeloyl-ACP methyl ester carboxylesterase
MQFARAATVTGVRLSARTWANRVPLYWDGPQVAHDRALVIVGGYGGGPDFYSFLGTSLEHAGIRRVAIMPPVENAFADIRVSAERLAKVVRLLGGDVDIIGHSEGGLVARWFVKHLHGDEVVRHVVTLGTPNRGLPHRIEDYPQLERYAAARRLHQVIDTVANRTVLPMTELAFRQMLRGSSFMQDLGQDVPPGRTEYLAVRSKWDGVVPFSASDLPPADNVANVALRGGPRTGNHAAIASTSSRAFEATMTFVRRP